MNSPNRLEILSLVSFSLEQWNSVWRSRHHIMLNLSNKYLVLFSEPPHHIRSVFHNFHYADLFTKKNGLNKIKTNLFSYQAPRWLPYLYKFPGIDAILKKLRSINLRSAFSKIGIKPDIIYIWHPSFAQEINEFDSCMIVYHCYDEFSSFNENNLSSFDLSLDEKYLLSRAHIVFAVSEKTKQRRLPFNSNIHVVSNGVDYQLFSKAQDESTHVPEDIKSIRGPIIGLVTTLTSLLDIGLLSSIFKIRPNWSFVFIGLLKIDKKNETEELQNFLKLPNVHVIGQRNQKDIPGYLKGCDVCTIPWIQNELSLSGSPLKLYEYLAAGKPVVSTPLEHLKFLANVIQFASTPSDWITAIEAALVDDACVDLRQSIAREHTWEKKTEFITQQLVDTRFKLSSNRID